MIPQLCFLQSVAITAKPNRQPSSPNKLHSIQHAKFHRCWIGFAVAATLHIAGFSLLGNDEAKQTMTPPQPIMVNWIGASTNQTQPVQMQKPVPTTHKTTKTVHTPKPTKPPQPVTTTTADSAAEIADQSQEPAIPAATQSTSAPETAAANYSAESTPESLSLPNLNADYLNNPAPAYPDLSRQLGEQGKVLLRVLVNTAGAVEQISLRKSSGYQRLDDAAQDTVKQWRFQPAKLGTQSIAAWVVVPISFSLEG